MKKIFTALILSIFLFSLISAITGSAIYTADDNSQRHQNTLQAENNEDNETENEETDSDNETQERERLREKIKEQVKEAVQERNKLRILNGTCPEECECSGSTVKCEFEDGSREMRVYAGNSGNMIFQVKGVNASTQVTLYKSNNSLYGVFKNNETKRILTPEQVEEKIQNRIEKRWELRNLTLTEEGYYEAEIGKKARLFLLFPVREKVEAQISAENGEIVRIRNPWWGWLAFDENEDEIVGNSCGTVTPGMNDECCQNKGYNLWNSETSECEFVEVEE